MVPKPASLLTPLSIPATPTEEPVWEPGVDKPEDRPDLTLIIRGASLAVALTLRSRGMKRILLSFCNFVGVLLDNGRR